MLAQEPIKNTKRQRQRKKGMQNQSALRPATCCRTQRQLLQVACSRAGRNAAATAAAGAAGAVAGDEALAGAAVSEPEPARRSPLNVSKDVTPEGCS